MYARHLSVVDFRSWSQAELSLQPGVNVLIGENGAGKTNLVEALGYLATLSSHRVASDAPLIRRGTDRAIVRAAVVNNDRELLLEIEVVTGRANRARINRAPVTRARDLLGVLRTVLFSPEDLVLVGGDPGERRRFLDEVLVLRAPRMLGVRADYERVLKQRTALLKSAGAGRRHVDLSTLDVWDEHLAEAGSALLAARLELVDRLRPHAVAAYRALAPRSEPIDLAYRSSLGDALPIGAGAAATGTSPDRELREALLGELQRVRTQELDRGVCLVGPHRDDLNLLLAGGPAKGFASHGESWSFALALKLGAFGLLRADGVEPVLILDDVFAELDAARRSQLIELSRPAEQVIVTAAVSADVPSELDGLRYRIAEAGIEQISAA